MAYYNRDYYSTKKKPSPLFYLSLTIISVLIIAGGFFLNASNQEKKLSFEKPKLEQLAFDSSAP